MRNIIVSPRSPLRTLFPLVQKLRSWVWKFHDRAGQRLVVSGGTVRFLDAELKFPEGVGFLYATPLFWNGPQAYEPCTSRAIALLAAQSRLFLDVGSNIGIYAAYVGVKLPKTTVVAFEPVPSIFKKNRAFLRANGVPETVTLNLAVSDRDGPQKMFLPVYSSALEEEQTATLNDRSWQVMEKQVDTFDIQCVTLDTFAAQNRLPDGVCCLKIDVENFEASVLRGGTQFIGHRRPWIVCELLPSQETDPATDVRRNSNQEAVGLITQLNYVTFAISASGFFRMTAEDFGRPREFKDFLLVPREKIDDDINYFALSSLAALMSEK